MVTLNINGRQVEAKENTTLLQAATEVGIEIPTLCHNEAVEPYGACRLCLVEISRKGRSRLVTSCLYPVEQGLEVKTDSERVLNTRRMVMELLLSRCPNNKPVQDMAKKFGIDKPEFELEDSHCILCGLCVRVCREVVGVSAISLVNRGTKREVASPFYETSQACIGCGSCVYICPTGVIKMEEVGDTRTIPMWKVSFKMKQCKVCGSYFAPEAQLEYIRKKVNLPADFYETCPDCR